MPVYPVGLHASGLGLFPSGPAHKKEAGGEDHKDGEKVDGADEENCVPKKAFRYDVNQHIRGRIQHP